MIEAIAKLLNDVGANKVALTIQTDDANNVTIVMNTFMPPVTDKKGAIRESAEIIKLRHALSAPLIIHGNIGEVDVEFSEQITQYAYGYEKGAQLLKSSSDLVSKIETASANVTAKGTSVNTAKKTETATQTTTHSVPTATTPVVKNTTQHQETSAFHIDDDEEGL